MESMLAVTAVLLFAVLVGFVIPVLLQLRATLRSAQQMIDTNSPRLEKTLQEASETLGRLNRVAGELETTSREARALIDRAKVLGTSIDELVGSLRRAGTAATGVGLGSTLVMLWRLFFPGRSTGTPAPAEPVAKEDR